MTIERVGHQVGRTAVPLLGGSPGATALESAAGRGDLRRARRPGRRAGGRAGSDPAAGAARGRQRRRERRHATWPRSPAGTRSCWRRRGTPTATRTSSTRYRPDVVQVAGGDPRELRAGTAHDLHPDLAVLLSTSGSTGSPKLVRLSLANVVANAAASPTTSAIRPTDRAITSLPLHYCYGLSVLHQPPAQRRRRRAHRPVGRRRVLLGPGDRGPGDQLGRRAVHLRAARRRPASATGRCPRLRYLTQAGGRMDPERVRAYAELGRERGAGTCS